SRRLDRLVQLPPPLVEQVDPYGAEAGRRRHLEAFLHVFHERRGRAAQRDRSGRGLRRSGRFNFCPTPACGGGQGGGFFCGGGQGGLDSRLLPFRSIGNIATADGSAWTTALDGGQVNALGLGQ